MHVVFPIDPERLFAQNGPATTTKLPKPAKAAKDDQLAAYEIARSRSKVTMMILKMYGADMNSSLESFFLYWKTKSDGVGTNAELFVTCADLGKPGAETSSSEATPSRFSGAMATAGPLEVVGRYCCTRPDRTGTTCNAAE